MKKKKSSLFLLILLFLFSQIFFIIYSRTIYKGVHDVITFIGVYILLGIVWYELLIKPSSKTISILKISMLILFTLGVPLITFTTQPKFTYEEGKELILKEHSEYDDEDFIENTSSPDIIWTTPPSNKFLVRDFAYYYRLSTGSTEEFFVVLPTDGKINKLEEDFFREYEN